MLSLSVLQEILAILRSPDYVSSLITGGLLVIVTIVWAPELSQWFRTTRIAATGRGAPVTDAQQIRLDPDPLEPYLLSQGFRVGDLVIVSGQAALDEQGNVVGAGDFDAQAEQVFRNLSRVLEAGGSSLDRVVKVTIFLTDMTNFGKIVELRRRWFTPPYPADTIVEVSALALPRARDRDRGYRGRRVRSRQLGWTPMAEPVQVTLFNDAGCPWGYSANPAFRVLEWRYGAQLEWRLVLIGLTDVAQEYVDRGYTPLRSAEGYARRFRRFGMPLAPNPRARIVGTGRSCRAIVAVRLQAPGREWAAFRALQFAFFTTTLAPRRGREHRSRASGRGRDRRRRGDRGYRHACGRGGLPARSSRGPQRRRLAHAAAGQARDERRPRSATRPRRSCSSTAAGVSRPVAGRRSRRTT